MARPSLLLAGCEELPDGSQDTPLLVPALEAAGFRVEHRPWTAVEPGGQDLCLLHTPWDYAWHPAAFDRWCASWGERLVNPLALVRWNAHKRYLAELGAAGVPTLPTLALERGGRVDLARVAAERGWQALVVKPAVGQTARETRRSGAADLAGLQAHVDHLASREDVLVQPYLPSITADGERSLVLIDGRCTHALRKRPAPGDWRVQDDFGGTVEPHEASAAEQELAQAALAAAADRAGAPALYGRVDLVRDGEQDRVIELELIEPELFLRLHPQAATDLAGALARQASG